MISNKHKKELSDLLAEGHRRFGIVAPRRPYRDDDDGSGEGELTFETHPLLSRMPVGASSDLTFMVTENKQAIKQADKRSNELNPQLRMKLEKTLQNQLQNKKSPTPTLQR